MTRLLTAREITDMTVGEFTRLGSVKQVEIFERLQAITRVMTRHNVADAEDLDRKLRSSDRMRSVMTDVPVAELLKLKEVGR